MGRAYVRRLRHSSLAVAVAVAVAVPAGQAVAQIPPSDGEVAAYRGIFAAAARGDTAAARDLLARGADPNGRDGAGRPVAHVAAHRGHHAVVRQLLRAGADPNALDAQRYDLVTIAAVRNDLPVLGVALRAGNRATNVTSPYDGTALIAAAHLGNVEAVRELLRAGAPVNHVNNLGWTALIEAVVLGDGGGRHQAVVRLLVAARADVNLSDHQGRTPLRLAEDRGYTAMAQAIRAAGGRRGVPPPSRPA